MIGAKRSPQAIRPARPEDAGFIARNVLFAQRGPLSRGWFDVVLGWPEPKVLAFVERIATARQQSWWHVSQFVIAEVDGDPAAALCALPAAGTNAAAQKAFAEVVRDSALEASELSTIVQRSGYTEKCWVQGGEADWMVEHVAALPSYRGRGLVQGLIDHALAVGRAAGYRQASISFLIGNEAAECCYAKAGFAFAEEKRDPAFEALTGAPGFRRFARGI
jgi:GNAT superfamily N-acetyltransferase